MMSATRSRCAAASRISRAMNAGPSGFLVDGERHSCERRGEDEGVDLDLPVVVPLPSRKVETVASHERSPSAASSLKLTSRIVAVHSAKHSSQVPEFTSRRYALPTLAIRGRIATRASLFITFRTPCCSISKPSSLDTPGRVAQAGFVHGDRRCAPSPRREGQIIHRRQHSKGKEIVIMLLLTSPHKK